ncbi:unnamed protein product [Brugia pahangi]|uniref:TonB-dependent receptor n=1 Tax=Brugia pahangi TaxID=6280 RepID=A0A0N4T8C8_BRUPA|nr:unnamed protein product [Brugia pahangi]
MNTSTYSYEATPFSNDWFNAKHMGQQSEHLSVGVFYDNFYGRDVEGQIIKLSTIDNVVITELGIN